MVGNLNGKWVVAVFFQFVFLVVVVVFIAGQYPSRQGNAGGDLCGVVRTHRIRAAIICHHIARSENLVDSDGTQLRCLSSKNVRKLALTRPYRYGSGSRRGL